MQKKNQIEAAVQESLEAYFEDLRGVDPHNVYQMLMNAVEKPMLEIIMLKAQNNQSRAAEWLGINRNTLRKKLGDHKLL